MRLQLCTVITPSPRQEKEKGKEKGGRKTVFKRGRLVISSN